MYTVVSKQQFSEKVFKLEITAPLIARSRKAGHFVIVRLGEKGERVPLTIAGADVEKGTITLVIQKVGHSSTQICDLNVGDQIADIVIMASEKVCEKEISAKENEELINKFIAEVGNE